MSCLFTSIFENGLANRWGAVSAVVQQVIGRHIMKLYGLKNCDSCKKALSQLRAAGHDIAFFDIRADPLDQSQMADLLARHGDQLVLNRK
jgi:hypothetical protein